MGNAIKFKISNLELIIEHFQLAGSETDKTNHRTVKSDYRLQAVQFTQWTSYDIINSAVRLSINEWYS